MNKSPAYQWYPKDILTSQRVILMTLAEEGAYRRALDFCWLNESLPNSSKAICKLVGKGCTKAMAVTIMKMFVEVDGVLRHERLDQEREKQAKHRTQRVDAANKRWDKSNSRNATASISHMQPKSKSNALHTATASSSTTPGS